MHIHIRKLFLIIQAKRRLWINLIGLTLATASVQADLPAYKNPQLPVEQRVADLLGRMTTAEKIAQLRVAWLPDSLCDAAGNFDVARAQNLFTNGLGEFGPIRKPIAQEVAVRNAAQKFVREKTRLGIPLIFHEEGCHGAVEPGASSFPCPAGLASSWDENLLEQVYTVVGAELRSRGVDHALTPVIDINRDPRWGRSDEMLGEDPYLNGRLGIAIVRGFQSRDAEHIDDRHVAATLKHLAGHGAPEAGVNRASAHLGPRELLETHLVPFQMVIAAAHPACIMPSYNEIDGIPSHANRWLLQDVVRKQFGFDGIFTSDYFGVRDLEIFHHVAGSPTAAALRAFNAGVDMDLPDGASFAHLGELVQAGKISEHDLDAKVARALRLKFQLGLFENPFADAAQARAIVNRESTKALDRKAAQESIVLLKNKNNLLPLIPDEHKTIAVIGPNADDTRLGTYSGEPPYRISILDGIREAVGNGANVVHAKGCYITKNEGPSSFAAWNDINLQKFPTETEAQARIAEAVKVAAQADLIVLVLGDNELICRESWSAEHYGDRASLDLFGGQNQLAEAMFALGKPVVVYLMNGRPLAIPHIIDRADAVLEGWYAGQETGHAAADILFGRVNPSAKLTITIPRSVGQIPIYYDHKPSSHSFEYVDEASTPLFPFGFGLSYTTFVYGETKLSAPQMKKDGLIEATIQVTNTGKVAGDEIVQLYLHDKIASVTRPVKELKDFQRIHLAAGASAKVTFTITPEMLAFYDENMSRVIEPDEFEVIIGPSSAEGKSVSAWVVE